MKYILPLMLEAARRVIAEHPLVLPIVSCAPGLDAERMLRRCQKRVPSAGVTQRTTDLLRAGDVGLVKSGTATLEAALLGLPMVVTYAGSWLAWLQWKLFVRRNVTYIAMPNIIADDEIVPELYDKDGSPERLTEEVLDILMRPGRREAMRSALAGITKVLGRAGASAAVADMIEEILGPETTLRDG